MSVCYEEKSGEGEMPIVVITLFVFVICFPIALILGHQWLMAIVVAYSAVFVAIILFLIFMWFGDS